MDEAYLYNNQSQKRICKYDSAKTIEQMLSEAGIAFAEVMVDKDGVSFTPDDLCIQMIHCDRFHS